MGRVVMATMPTMTMRMAMTMATMGRLIKNFAMADYLFAGAAGADGLD